jgi:uncharacterized membrane protein
MHYFHPALVHFSVALLILGGLSEAWGLLRDHPTAARFGTRLLILGVVSLVPTLFTGYVAANTLDVGEASRGLLAAHERNGWILFAIFGIAMFWKAWGRGELPGIQRKLFAIWLLLAVLFTAYNAFLGGELVYLHGVGVASIGSSF